MMNAEMASEITRSRNQTASTGTPRGAGLPSIPSHDVLGLPRNGIPGTDSITNRLNFEGGDPLAPARRPQNCSKPASFSDSPVHPRLPPQMRPSRGPGYNIETEVLSLC